MLVRFTDPKTKLAIYYRAEAIIGIGHSLNPLGTALMTTIPASGGYVNWIVQEGCEECAERINSALGSKESHSALLRSQ